MTGTPADAGKPIPHIDANRIVTGRCRPAWGQIIAASAVTTTVLLLLLRWVDAAVRTAITEVTA